MSLGCPVITSDFEVFHEVGRNSCLYFKNNDYKDLSIKVEKLVKNKILRKKLIKLGLERSKKFTWKNCARSTAKLYNRLYANKHLHNNKFNTSS